jgi:hypothetical protein
MVAALLGLFLIGGGGCARWETSLRRQNGEKTQRVDGMPDGDETDPLEEPQVEEAFQRLQAARAVMPRRQVIVDSQATVSPPPRVVSPFLQPVASRAGGP